ncbi:glycosyltransferase family 4 protein [Alkalibacillus aidingensis]|uniref:glycosyltransferase family 4 protein n=1 Tax=Alkalibacillus aidingensis TaxID=2747607 RepID=UPI0016615C4B|nr:glycosyltransferase family 4 protein [Alkalibacillus aidingensis]
MKVMHVISGGETGGSKNHIISLLQQFTQREILLVVMQEGMLSQEAEAAGISVINLNQKSRYDLKARKRLKEITISENVDIIHTHGARANWFVATIINKLNVKWITTVHSDPIHDFMKTGLKGKIFTRLNLWTYQKIDHFFAVSEPFKDNLVHLGVPERKITTILNGIKFENQGESTLTRNDLSIDKDAFVITMVARLHPIKGHKELIQAIRQVIDNHPDQRIDLVLVGDGTEREALEELAKDQNIQPNIHFLGYRDDVWDIYRLSNVGILTSYSESFPLALLEAAREKLPLIATRVGGIPQLVEKYGWVIEPKSVESIVEALEEALRHFNEGTLTNIGEQQYTYAKENFSVERLSQQTRNTYIEIKKEI